MTWALVTGASSGIGRSFVRQLAAEGYDVVLVARDRERLEVVARDVTERLGRTAEVLVADLTDREATQKVAERVASPEQPVEVLVNNAGWTTHQRFVDGDLAREEDALEVMVRAVMVLSHAAAKPMVARGRGRIINVSSMAGFVPGGSYSAAKAWVTTFTQALASELDGTGVTATAVCPGYTRTEFHERAGMDMSSLPELAWLDADDVVAQALRDSARGRSLSIPGPLYRAARVGLALLPDEVLRRMLLRRPGSAR